MFLTTFLKKLILLIFAVPLVSTLVSFNPPVPCHIPYAFLPFKEPILTTINGDLILPSGPGITLNFCDPIQLSCTGSGNYLKIAPNTNYVTAKCMGWLNFKVGEEDDKKSIVKLGCKNSVTASSWKTNVPCGVDSEIYEIGHIIPPTQKKQPLYSVCYNEKEYAVEYTSHVIHGSAINYSKKNLKSNTWKLLGLNNTIDEIWTVINNKFKELIGDNAAKNWFSKNIYLQKGHLSPFADFVFASSKLATLSYFNHFPQWNTINNGNWKAVEKAVRKKSVELGKDILIVTGTYGVLNLQEKNMVFPPYYSIPNYVWKLVLNLESDEGIGFVTSNNPFHDEKFTLCKDICNENDWKFTNKDSLEKGKTYCCTALEMINFIKPLNNLIYKQLAILKGPKHISDL